MTDGILRITDIVNNDLPAGMKTMIIMGGCFLGLIDGRKFAFAL